MHVRYRDSPFAIRHPRFSIRYPPFAAPCHAELDAPLDLRDDSVARPGAPPVRGKGFAPTQSGSRSRSNLLPACNSADFRHSREEEYA
jgi:hypothetical protein